MFRVDLEAIIQLRGRSYSLIDQRGPCRLLDCTGKAFFMWSPGRGVPYRPLWSERGELARMFGKTLQKEADPSPDDDPTPPRPMPPVPLGVSPDAWAKADERERKRLVRIARG
jgi:hypothetical protein